MSLNEQPKPNNEPLSTVFFVIACIAVLAGLFALGWGEAEAKYEAKQGKQIVLKKCTVKYNSAINVKGVMMYDLKTTCGNFTPIDGVERNLKVGETYDLVTSDGNWTTTNPLVLSAEVSSK